MSTYEDNIICRLKSGRFIVGTKTLKIDHKGACVFRDHFVCVTPKGILAINRHIDSHIYFDIECDVNDTFGIDIIKYNEIINIIVTGNDDHVELYIVRQSKLTSKRMNITTGDFMDDFIKMANIVDFNPLLLEYYTLFLESDIFIKPVPKGIKKDYPADLYIICTN